MTAYAVHLARERVVIASDTAIYVPGRPPAPQRIVGYVTKVHPIAHLRAAIFGRGIGLIPAEAAALIGLSPELNTIERVVETMPKLLRLVTTRYCRSAGIDDPRAYGLAEVFLAGWSEADRRMCLWMWQNVDDWQTVAAGGEGRTLALPPLPGDQMPPRRGSLDAHLVAVMKAERRFFGEHPECGVVVAGEVQIWQIIRDGISQRVVHRFPDFGRPADAELTARIANRGVGVAERLFTAAEMRDPRAA